MVQYKLANSNPPRLGSQCALTGLIAARTAASALRLMGILFLLMSPPLRADEEADQFFEAEVRPVLIDNCGRCHGSEKQSGGLRVDSRPSLIKGGHTAAAIVPGDVSQSLLIQAVLREGEVAMPPDEELSDRAIRALQRWIEMGAPWPASDPPMPPLSASAARQHWAFQPIQRPSVPQIAAVDTIQNPVDSFVVTRLNEKHLTLSPPADRHVLIRRVTYTLTGLPPSQAEVDRFVNDPDPRAYERLVERLLESPQYGEQWARHWLDVARYSDTKGYVYAREERFWAHAWAYRDWVVKSLNEDMPYDRFLLLQLAADQLDDRLQGDLSAMGFLTLGRRFLGVDRDIIDDQIDVVCRGTMGLTVSCARCHDHKYDPIPSADYYSLYGVFDSCIQQLVSLESSSSDQEFANELGKRQALLATQLAAHSLASSERVRKRIADYLFAQTQLHKYPANGFDQIFETDDLLPAFVRRWKRYLRTAKLTGDPLFTAWHEYASIPTDSFAEHAVERTRQLQTAPAGKVHPGIAKAFEQPPKSFREVCDRYAEVFAGTKRMWEATIAHANETGSETPTKLSDPNAEALRGVLYGPQAPCQVPDGPISHSETYFDSAACTELWKLQGEVDRWIINSKVQAPFALALIDQPIPNEPRIFLRGDPLHQGKDVPRQFLSVLAGEQREPFAHGSGRLELALAIVDPGNPLTARVIVNRLWTHHFGHGLVSTPSDFGSRAAPPSHPLLLDWLASEFIAEGWSLKKLHRWIVLSATYRQSSWGPSDPAARRKGMQTDPENRWLWRMNVRRLTFEEFRDSLLSATNELDLTMGGKPTNLLEPPYPVRRTLYGLVDRQYLPGTLRMFDFANPDLHVPKRNETTVPQQALFFMNHPLVLQRATALAKPGRSGDDRPKRIATMFQQVFQRSPTDVELCDALALVDAASMKDSETPRATVVDWQYGYGALDEAAGAVTGFTPLPHFTGNAWQGGAKWPDATLGWVQLTATGGHPGNDRNHAAIRRWTAPHDITIRIRSELTHEPTAGDGIRAFVVSSDRGIIQSTTVHHDHQAIHIESLTVTQGSTVDFVVDIGDVLNSDQYLWESTIEQTSGRETAWNSRLDFQDAPVNRLDGWEQLAQVLLCSNEFIFVD